MERSLRAVARAGRDAYMEIALARAERPADAGFSDEVIAFIAASRKKTVDTVRVDRALYPTIWPVAAKAHTTMPMVAFIRSHSEGLNKVASYLDEESRYLLKTLFAYRALGPVHVTIPTSLSIPDNYPDAQKMKIGGSLVQAPPFECSLYRVPFEGHVIELECWLVNVVCTFLLKQYYFQRSGHQIAPRPGDIAVDAGSCFGDTALAFAASVGSEGRVHSFEPIPKQIAVFKANMARNPELQARIQLHKYALSDVAGRKLRFSDEGAGAKASNSGSIDVETTTVDHLVSQGALPRVDFIKMDIEGAELAAIRGAADSIRKFKPRLAISVYHNDVDFIDIPLALKALCPDYRLFLDHYTMHEAETILYASIE